MEVGLSRWHTLALGTLLAAVATLFAAPAQARAPRLESAGASGGLVKAGWSLPPNVRSVFFEVAKYPDVNVFGYFRERLVRPPGDPLDGEESQVRFGVLDAAQTSLTSGDPSPPLPAGTYYVHVGGNDAVHTGCPRVEFSDIFQISIGADGSAATSTQPVAPGTGDCTLVRTVGGSSGGGGGGGGKAVPGDKTPPTTKLRYSRRQDIDKLRVRARMSEPGTMTVRAFVDVGGLLARIYNFRPLTRKVTGGVLATLRPKLSKKKKRALKRAMRRGKRLRARITLTAVDRAGNSTTKHAVIRLKR